MLGLANYGSDDDDDKDANGQHPHQTAAVAKANGELLWKECVDQKTGYAYYWNTKTNEVRWEKPVEVAKAEAAKAAAKVASVVSSSSSSSSSRSRSPAFSAPEAKRSKRQTTTASRTPPVVYGPTLPEPKPEEIAARKIKQLEEELAVKVMSDVKKERPLDWQDGCDQPRGLHKTTFRWHQRKPQLETWRDLLAKDEEKRKTSSMALIAGVYGDDDTDEEDQQQDSKSSKSVDNTKSSSKEDKGDRDRDKRSKTEDVRRDKRGRKVYDSATGDIKPVLVNVNGSLLGSKYRKTIDNVGETLCEKLEALNVSAIQVSALKQLAIQVEVRTHIETNVIS